MYFQSVSLYCEEQKNTASVWGHYLDIMGNSLQFKHVQTCMVSLLSNLEMRDLITAGMYCVVKVDDCTFCEALIWFQKSWSAREFFDPVPSRCRSVRAQIINFGIQNLKK